MYELGDMLKVKKGDLAGAKGQVVSVKKHKRLTTIKVRQMNGNEFSLPVSYFGYAYPRRIR